MFQSTPPVRGATALRVVRRAFCVFQSTPPVRGATRSSRGCRDSSKRFNPRPPCGERRLPCGDGALVAVVSIHAPRAGSDPSKDAIGVNLHLFQSTPPVRGATAAAASIGALNQFQSTPPVRGATQLFRDSRHKTRVSIHAPRAGSDARCPTRRTCPACFNPRPPCGERPAANWHTSRQKRFNPRPPCGERPEHTGTGSSRDCFNPRPPCGERRGPPAPATAYGRFNPRPPCGERP